MDHKPHIRPAFHQQEIKDLKAGRMKRYPFSTRTEIPFSNRCRFAGKPDGCKNDFHLESEVVFCFLYKTIFAESAPCNSRRIAQPSLKIVKTQPYAPKAHTVMRISSELVPHERQRIHSVSQLFQPLIQVFRFLWSVYKIMILNLRPRSMYLQI